MVQQYAADAAVNSVAILVLTELASGVGGAAATQVVVMVGTRIATIVATTGAAAGGATVGGAVAGGAGGSTLGPGTIVGALAGLVVGYVIDLWLTESFKETLASQLNDVIDQIESSIVVGENDRPGLAQSLDETCDVLRDAYRQTLHDQLLAGATP